MSKNRYRVAINIPARTRDDILRRWPPLFQNKLAKSITWAYNVPADFSFDRTPGTVEVYGIHRGLRTDAVLVRFGGEEFQAIEPTYLHLTLSTAPGVQPVEAGREIQSDYVIRFPQPLTFTGTLEMFPLWDMARIGEGKKRRAA